jgi:cytochrome P450/glutathione S-transferase
MKHETAEIENDMKIIVNELDPIHFRKGHPYAKQVPTFVSEGRGGLDEIARWILDANGIAYVDQIHMPLMGAHAVGRLIGESGLGNSPVLVMTDTLIYGVDSVVRYFEQRCSPRLRMIPDGDSRSPVMDLYRRFTGELDEHVQKYMLSRLLDERGALRKVFGERAALIEHLEYVLFFPIIRWKLSAQLRLGVNTPEERWIEIRKIFNQVSELLSDGRRYLCGDRITIADVAFASVGAPVILPEEFGGVIPSFKQVSQAYRSDVSELRKTAAGQFVLRVYQEDRPTMIPQSELPPSPGPLAGVSQRVSVFLNARQPGLFSFLQRRLPVVQLPMIPIAAVTRISLVVEMLTRDGDFTIEEINSRKMALQKGAFFLGWDKNNPQFDREREFARSAVLPADLALIRSFLRESCARVLADNRHYQRIDVANTLCRPILVRLIDSYFGIAAPNDRMMMDWLRILFYDLFLNFFNNSKIHAKAVEAGTARRDWVRQVIIDRLAALNVGGTLPDNVLNRMILLSRKPGYEWADEDVVNRSIGGLITGMLETTNKAVVHVLSVLLDRPEIIRDAIEAASANDMDRMYGYVAEALRFLPVQPGVLRYCENDQTLTGGASKVFSLRGKTYVLATTAAAMFDPVAFPEPMSFDAGRIGRNARYMNFGFGVHECFGRYINAVTIPEFVAAILRLPGIQRSTGMTGRGVGLKTLGFPNNFVVSFEPRTMSSQPQPQE